MVEPFERKKLQISVGMCTRSEGGQKQAKELFAALSRQPAKLRDVNASTDCIFAGGDSATDAMLVPSRSACLLDLSRDKMSLSEGLPLLEMPLSE